MVAEAGIGTVALKPPDQSGFLSRDESDGLFRAHLYIAAMGRSGSTLLCDLLTVPQRTFCMIEPWFMLGVRSEALAQQFGRNTSVSRQDFMAGTQARDHMAYLARYRSLLAPALDRLEAWGVKEVRPEFHQPTIDTINPRHVLVLVRDARAVAASFLNRHRHDGWKPEQSVAWVESYLAISAAALVRLSGMPGYRVVRYEDFTRSAAERQAVGSEIGWPLEGTPNASFDIFGREWEAASHQGKVTPDHGGVFLHNDAEVQLADRVHDACEEYQNRFGYYR